MISRLVNNRFVISASAKSDRAGAGRERQARQSLDFAASALPGEAGSLPNWCWECAKIAHIRTHPARKRFTHFLSAPECAVVPNRPGSSRSATELCAFGGLFAQWSQGPWAGRRKEAGSTPSRRSVAWRQACAGQQTQAVAAPTELPPSASRHPRPSIRFPPSVSFGAGLRKPGFRYNSKCA